MITGLQGQMSFIWCSQFDFYLQATSFTSGNTFNKVLKKVKTLIWGWCYQHCNNRFSFFDSKGLFNRNRSVRKILLPFSGNHMQISKREWSLIFLGHSRKFPQVSWNNRRLIFVHSFCKIKLMFSSEQPRDTR